MDRFQETLRQYWGYDDFRGIQREIIQSIGSEAFAGRPTAATVLNTHIYIEAQQAPSVEERYPRPHNVR